MNFFPFRMLRRSWQYHLLTNMKEHLEDTPEDRSLIHGLFRDYPEGCYVRDTINNKRGMVRYIGRYIRHPAVAESRIESYDGEQVTFWYLDTIGSGSTSR